MRVRYLVFYFESEIGGQPMLVYFRGGTSAFVFLLDLCRQEQFEF